MKPFLSCLAYILVTSILGFVLGRVLPKRWFRYQDFPYRCAPFEKNGTIYHKLHIKSWQNKVPDMSKILPGTMPAKRLEIGYSKETLVTMLQETCVAEFIHGMLCITGLGCFVFWKEPGAVILYLLYVVLGNLPFMVIQRYNRPRLAKLLLRYEGAEQKALDRSVPCIY